MDRFEKALRIFEENNGVLRTSQAVSLGIHYETLYRLLKQGKLLQVSRGLYRLASIGAAPFKWVALTLVH
jgi:putative AbiEi antitoxin of type IV toxin-antitoxin system